MPPRLRLTITLAVLLLAAGCGVKVVPQPTATARLDPAAGALTEIHAGIAVTVRLDQLSVQPYQMIDNLSSFHVTVDNRSGEQLRIAGDLFLLRDGEGRQYRTVAPEQVREIVGRDTVYLIPYPYVGYYYLEDQERDAFGQTLASALPFYAEYRPQDIFTRALPAGPVLPGSKVSGVIYFLADPSRTDRVELLLYPDAAMQGEPRYRFPFRVE